jgi:hypothetical protein
MDSFKQAAIDGLWIGGFAALMNFAGVDNMISGAVGGVIGGVAPPSFVGPLIVGGTVAAVVMLYNLTNVYVKRA